jgi:hypothetical protein
MGFDRNIRPSLFGGRDSLGGKPLKEKYPIETLLALREQGLSYREIGKKTGLEHSGVRKRILNYQKHGKDPTMGRPPKKKKEWPYIPNKQLKNSGPLAKMKTYKMSKAEIERRYGKPGEFAEPVGTAVTFGWPDGGEENERHYARKE